MNKCIRYADFERILTELGFTHTLIDGRQIIFENAAYDALLVFPPYRPQEVVQPHDWMKTRHTVDVMGILDRDEFDKRLDRCEVATGSNETSQQMA